MKNKKIRRFAVYDDNAMTLKEFLRRNKLSRSTYYSLHRAGQGPVQMRVGRSIRISYSAERRWTRLMESEEITAVNDRGRTK